MSERKRFIEDYLRRETTVSSLATIYGVSRKTANKWLARFRESGLSGLAEASRAPHVHPNATPREHVELVLAAKRRYQLWGPRKLHWWLQTHHPEVAWPVRSTIGEILKREGMTRPRPHRKRTTPGPDPLLPARRPNDVWAIDFKGWFRTRDGKRTDPLTLSDVSTRYLLRCEALAQPRQEEVRRCVEGAFREYGLPWAIRSDNGSPFASVGLGGLSELGVWWIRLGITPERIRPGRPDQNGRHERMHRTLKDHTAKPPKADRQEQQEAFDRFRTEYNEERPHESLGMTPPVGSYAASGRRYPERLPEVEYGKEHVVRSVRNRGAIKWRGEHVYLNSALAGERIGMLPLADGLWGIDFGHYRLGYYDARTERISREVPRTAKVSPMCPV